MYHCTQVNQKSQSYNVWFLRYGVRQTDFIVILGHFLPFFSPPPDNPENKNFEKLHCTINDDHMMYDS